LMLTLTRLAIQWIRWCRTLTKPSTTIVLSWAESRQSMRRWALG
jgi:hypothetical protein